MDVGYHSACDDDYDEEEAYRRGLARVKRVCDFCMRQPPTADARPTKACLKTTTRWGVDPSALKAPCEDMISSNLKIGHWLIVYGFATKSLPSGYQRKVNIHVHGGNGCVTQWYEFLVCSASAPESYALATHASEIMNAGFTHLSEGSYAGWTIARDTHNREIRNAFGRNIPKDAQTSNGESFINKLQQELHSNTTLASR